MKLTKMDWINIRTLIQNEIAIAVAKHTGDYDYLQEQLAADTFFSELFEEADYD